MPVKTYRCDSCGHRFEQLFFKQEEETSLACPSCNSSQLTRSFWEQTVSMGARKDNECRMGLNSSECPAAAAPGGG